MLRMCYIMSMSYRAEFRLPYTGFPKEASDIEQPEVENEVQESVAPVPDLVAESPQPTIPENL